MQPSHSTIKISMLLAAGVAALLTFRPASGTEGAPTSGDLEFTDARAQSEQFIAYYDSIELDDAQEAIKRAALEPLPAACCSDNSAYTCCCPCNLSKSIWGLSAHLIAERGADAETVRSKVQEWTAFINPDGYSGHVCTTAGGCMRPFAEDGCGGMHGAVNW